MFEYNGDQYTEQEIMDAASSAGLSVDDYTSKHNITKIVAQEGKTNATVEETAPVVAETPADTELQSASGSLESPRRSVRGQVRKRDIQRNENIFNEKVSNAEKGFYSTTAVDVDSLYDETQKSLETEFAIANKPVTKGTYMGSTYTYTPADEYTGAKKDMYDIYTSSGQIDLSDDYFAETLYKKKRALATTYIDDLPTDIKEQVEKNVEKDFGQVQEKVQSIENAVNNAVSTRSRFEAGEELTEDEIKEYKAFVTSVPKLQEEYADAAAASKDAGFALDYFKKSYKIADQIGAAFKTTGLEMASGALEIGNMMAAEKDYQSSASKYVNDVLIAHQKDIEENLEAPVSLDDLKASGDTWSGADTWAAQLFANQAPFLLAASTGNAAPYLFGAIGTTSRLSQFSVEEQTARENINKLEKELLEATDDFDMAAIKSDIEKNKNITKKNDGLKLLTSVGHGAAEMIDGYTDKFLLGGIKKSWRRIGPDEFKASWKQAGKQYTAGVLTETGSESVTQVGQNAFDIWFDNADKSYWDGLDEAAAGGFVMGNGFKVTEFGGVARNIVANVAANKEQRAEVAKLIEKLNGFRNIIDDPNASEAAKKEAKTQRQKTEKQLVRLNDVTLARFEKLGFEDQQQVMELDRQSRSVNRRWTKIAVDNSLTDAEKDAMRVELEAEFNQKQDQKRAILQTTSPANLVSSDKVKTGLFEEGDLFREIDDGNVSLQKIKAHNKKTGYVKAAVEVSDQALEDINNFVEEGDTNATIEVDGARLNFDQAVAIATQNEGRNGLYDPNSGVIAYMPQRGRSKGKSLAAVPLHEYLHAAFVSLKIPKSEFAAIKKDLLNTIEDIDLPENKKNAIKQSIDLYDQRISKRVDEGDITAQQAEEIGGEEIFNIIGDVIAQDVLRGNKKQDFLQKLSIRVKNLLNGRLDVEVVDGLNVDTAQGALEFVKRFQEDVTAGKTITKQTLSGTTTDEKAKTLASEISEIVENVTFEEGSVNQEFKKFTYDGKKNTAPESFQAEAAMAYEPLAQAVVDRISKVGLGVSKEQDQFIMDYLADNQNKQDIVSDLTFGTERNKASSLLGLAKSYNPEVGSFGGYAKSQLANRAIRILEERVGKQVTQGAQTIDAPESREVAAEDQQTETADTRNVFEKLNLPKEIVAKANKLAELASIKADKALTGKDVSDLKKVNARNKAFNDIFGKQLFKDIANELGKNTKTSNAFSQFIDKNYDSLSDIALENIDFQKGGGPAALWNIDNPPSKEEFLDYYEAKDEKASTKSDRKKSLNNAIARQIGNEARIEFAKKDPATAKLFKEKHGVVLASEIPENAQQFLNYKDLKQLFKDKNITYDYLLNTKESIDEFFKDIQPLLNAIPLEMVNRALLRPTPRIFKKGIGDKKGRKSKIKSEVDYYNEINNYYDTKLEAAVKEATETNANKLEGDAAGYVARAFEKMGLTEQKIKSQWDSGYIQQENKQNMAMHNQMWQPIYEAILKDPNNARAVGWLMMRTSDAGATHWHRMGAEMVGYSTNPVGNKKGTYIYEHAMQAKNAYLFLIESALNGVPFGNAYPAMTNNYKVIALDRFQDDKLTSAKYGELMPSGWNVYTGSWTQRYFDPQVAIFDGGIPPESIVDFNNQSIADKYNIDANGHSTKAMASEVLSGEFNQILERVKGVKAEARYSEDRATKLAANKGKFKFFVPYSAEDFVGLIYPTLGKGKEGDKNMQWYKENLLDPFARGISAFESSKQKSMDDWRKLKKQIKNTPADLGKEAVRGFTNEEAVRVYLWDQQGVTPSTLAQKDVTFMVRHVKNNEQLLNFAESVKSVLGGQYPAPQGDWIAGTLTTDLINDINTTTRKENLEEWQSNVDAVYSKDNLNKLKAIYGQDYVDALENILYRMKTGRNRPMGKSKIENQFMNWVNDSVATVMFLNTRSALLQTISSINFMNWSDNNPLMAAKAFANQPQFWKDFASLMNSDFLKQRRGGLKNDVNADELAREAATNTNKAKAAFAALLKAGFAPTQIADSFAISIGGASFYRNRVNTYVKQGLDQKQAEEKAMLDFQENAEESQQSSRPDKVSMEQASGLGRVILAFANTPAQYTRLTKKAALDLINGRGDWKTNASKILYYGAVQNIIFTTLQQALFALSFDDEKDEEEAMTKVANGIVDTLLRGSGVYGAGVATMKNMILEAIRQYKSKRTDYTKVALKLTTLSPPVDTKIRKLMSAGRAFTYKQSKKDMRELGIDVDNPAALAVGQIASALGNVPLDRAVLKLQNLKAASNQERETWEQIFLAMGYSDWQLGIDDDKSEGFKSTKLKRTNKVNKGRLQRTNKLKRGTPNKRLERGVAGKAHNDGTIEVDPNLSPVEREKTIAHEKKHVEDMKAGKLNYDDNYVYWNGSKHKRKNGKIKYNGKSYEEGHKSLPWEKRAYDAEPTTKEIKKRIKLY